MKRGCMQDPNNLAESGFDQLMADVTPMKQDDRVAPAKPVQTLAQRLKRQALEKEAVVNKNYLTVESVEPVEPFDILEYKKDGVQEGVYKNLRLGKYRIETVVNLQNKKLEQASALLFDTVHKCYSTGKRTILVKHGKGINDKPFPAFIKSYVNQWLRQMPEVLAFHSCTFSHGGSASVYVFIKKNEEQKLSNGELHRRRS